MTTPRFNPFRTAVTDALFYRGANWGEVIARFETLKLRGAVIGPHGTGKTTFLESFGHELARRGYGVVSLVARDFEPPALIAELQRSATQRSVVLLDGAGQISAWHWWRIRLALFRTQGAVITEHKTGRFPTLWECRTDIALFLELVREMTEQDEAFPAGLLEQVFTESNGNVRQALRLLYDVAALM